MSAVLRLLAHDTGIPHSEPLPTGTKVGYTLLAIGVLLALIVAARYLSSREGN